MFSEELQRIKQASAAQQLTLSEFIRSTLLSAIPAPINSQSLPSSLADLATDNESGRASLGRSATNISRSLCIHGFRIHRNKSTQCPTCANVGIQYKYQYD